jgi:glycerophosphoryl diester phosphodiesterase
VKGRIGDMTWDEVSKLRLQRRIDMGGGNIVEFPTEERIPLLEEVLAEYGGKLLMDIELKPATPSWQWRHTGTETAKIIRYAGVFDSVISTSFDFFKLYYLEKEYSDVLTGYAYDDDSLGGIEAWAQKIPEFRGELSQPGGNQNAQSFTNWLMETNFIGKTINSSAVISEHTLIDSDTIARFHARGMIVGSYTFFPLDLRNVRDPNTDFVAELERVAAAGIDWIETDDPVRALKQLEARSR